MPHPEWHLSGVDCFKSVCVMRRDKHRVSTVSSRWMEFSNFETCRVGHLESCQTLYEGEDAREDFETEEESCKNEYNTHIAGL